MQCQQPLPHHLHNPQDRSLLIGSFLEETLIRGVPCAHFFLARPGLPQLKHLVPRFLFMTLEIACLTQNSLSEFKDSALILY